MSTPANEPCVIFAEVVSKEDVTKKPEFPTINLRVKITTNVGPGKQRTDETVYRCAGYFYSTVENLIEGETVIIKFCPTGRDYNGKFFSDTQLLSIKPQNMERPVAEGQPRASDGLNYSNPEPVAAAPADDGDKLF